jgi:predicted transcriptional regulator
LTAQITASYVGHNNVPANDVPQLIATIYQSLAKLGSSKEPSENRPEPAISVRRSVAPDYIVCLEDGKKLKMLKRHLKTSYNMTPEQYRERWGLAADYPMVAPNYAKQRSKLAKQIGLGTASRRGLKQKAA